MSLSHQFLTLSAELCSHLYVKNYNKEKINSLIDELNSKPYKAELFVGKQDAAALVTSLYVNIKPVDEFLAAKTSHLINNIVTKQNLQFTGVYLGSVIAWHIDCIKKCSDIIIPDILHNLQCILHVNPQSGRMFITDLIGQDGLLIKLINNDKYNQSHQNTMQIYLIVLKCIINLLKIDDNKKSEQADVSLELKEDISQLIIRLLMKGFIKSHDESIYCKVIISALRILSHIYFNDQKVDFPMPEIIGLCRHFILYGIVSQEKRPEKIMPAQQSIAAVPVKPNAKGGKKQKIRKQRNNAIESLKKEIPVSDRSLMRDVGNFENNSAYKPASQNFLETQKTRNCWALTSDSDMSDVENGREAKLIALRSRVRQSAANLFLVVFKIKEKKDIFGYWWALLPDSPDANNWLGEEKSKKTLAYCAVTDPIASSRASALSVILTLLAGSKMYLSQAETCKKTNASFIPFSVSLGYIVTCMHKILVGILDSERSHSVIIVALKCCAALVQSTPYHKMQEGLIVELVRSTRKFLIHRDVTLQVGALITIGCVISIDPKVDEVLKSLEKDTAINKIENNKVNKENIPLNDECDDFEEGYSDDEMFTAFGSTEHDEKDEKHNTDVYFKSWILDICFKNMGWMFKDNEVARCKPSAIPIILESLQVLSAIAFHHLKDLLDSHITLLADILSEMLLHEHQDIVLQTARLISVIGDAIQRLDQQNQSLPLNQCVHMWEKLITPLSMVLQNHENVPAKAVVCDCIANIGEKSFKELPDICFVTDCGENILRALADPTAVVRTKAAWALGNLSDALVLNMDEPDTEDIDDDLLLRLLEVSVQCANDNDKVKMSATRGLGNLLRLIKNENLQRHTQLKSLCEKAIEKLLECAIKVTNMKVRWNACYALGNAMKNENLFTCFNGWQSKVFPSLCTLSKDCKNLKVRINAAVALRAPALRAQYGEHYTPIWRGVMAAMENAANDDDFTEYKHKDNLIEQLCVTLAHLCCLLKPSDLTDILDPLVFHFDCAKSLYIQLYNKLPPENASCLKILQAAKYVTMDLTPENETQMQSLGMLQDIFIWEV
ncbi:HEAT repeat-containing protein 6 isoform X1 [Vanessa cardui]|uniref:HEAT repeat-containing protein 6 isoform X1 n=1 Tax=Vanessa cardui TaxID=171605 RepID=UPI001F13CE8E|nr:HEAT repeat-containing protein 6 isoform X1 [Vanessa cardui]